MFASFSSSNVRSTIANLNQFLKGGGVAVASGHFDASFSNFSSNTAGATGAGIQAISAQQVPVQTCNFDNNVGACLPCRRGESVAPAHTVLLLAGANGGGLSIKAPSVTLNLSKFTGNKANGGNGGGALVDGDATVISNAFTSNSASGIGGGLHTNGATTVTVRDLRGHRHKCRVPRFSLFVCRKLLSLPTLPTTMVVLPLASHRRRLSPSRIVTCTRTPLATTLAVSGLTACPPSLVTTTLRILLLLVLQLRAGARLHTMVSLRTLAGSAGAVYCTTGTGTETNSTFSGNSAGADGGAIVANCAIAFIS